MAARDNVLFGASVASGTAAGTVIPLSLVYGIENVRQGYGAAKLKSVQAYFSGAHTGASGIPVSIKNSNWIDAAGVVAQRFSEYISLNTDSLSFMRGRDKVLQPNTSWIIEATLDTTTTAAGYIYVLLEIEYADVPGVDAEITAGSPVMKYCKNSSVTGAARVPVSIGTFDNLLQGVTYVLSEVSASGLAGDGAFIVIEGFSTQKGLTRILPAKATGLAMQLKGSVYMTKQTYNVAVINDTALSSAAVAVRFEMIASTN